ncbi:MAG: hypothetical protein ACJ8GO_08615 [Ramlibacter sp.]
MAISARLRWTLYGFAGIATVVAMWAGDGGPRAAAPEVVAPTVRATPAPRVSTESLAAIDPATDLLAQRKAASPTSSSDPFADMQDVPVATAAPPVAQPAASIAAPAPSLPYTYVGKWEEKGQTVVYLQENGEHVVQVHGPGRLNDQYTVVSVLADRLVLKNVPTGTRHILAFARTSAAGSPAAPGQDGGAAAGGSQEEN